MKYDLLFEDINFKVIDNFLDKEYFDSLVTLFTDKDKMGNQMMPWFFQSGISNHKVVEGKLFYMTHLKVWLNRQTKM